MKRLLTVPLLALLPLLLGSAAAAPPRETLEPMDVFELEWASDPRISPDGETVAYVRNFMDVTEDRRRSNLWRVDREGRDHRPLTSGLRNDGSPRWSPDGSRLAYVSSSDGSSQIYVRWMDTGQTARVTNLTESPSGLAWSPDGRWIAFTMRVPSSDPPLVKPPARPDGAEWADPPRVIDELVYRRDGRGFVEEGFSQVFVVPADGGTPRALTSGEYQHGGPLSWTPDSKSIVFCANRSDDWEYEGRTSDVHVVPVEGGDVRTLTDHRGPCSSPRVSPDGALIAFTGFEDRLQGYQVTRLEVMDRDGNNRRTLTASLDRDAASPVWSAQGSGLYFQYDDEGDTRIGFVDLGGNVTEIASGVGGTSIGRPYSGGSFTVAPGGRFAFTHTTAARPSDVAVGRRGDPGVRVVTRLNEDLLGPKELATIEEIQFPSSFDGRSIQGWLAKPPGFAPEKTYPLILEIHGGPFANYGPRFSAEVQLYAAAGYAVLYVNPRGSTSYGEEFGNLIHHRYPSEDYDDLMSGVDAAIARGFVDPEQLFVTGGSGGGVLTAWIVGKTDRFRAAVSAKPVINWTSFALTADLSPFFTRYWFPGMPWEEPEHYHARSPLSLAGNVTTPTMLLTGEEDYRTPIGESEQFYLALKLRKVDTLLVRIPGASHGIARRPSQLMAKVRHVLAWFDRYRDEGS